MSGDPRSLRLRLLEVVFRVIVKRRLRATPTPDEARVEFDRFARYLLPRPPFLLRQTLPGPEKLDVVRVRPASCGGSGVILYFHGGAYIAGSPATHESLAGRLSGYARLPVVLPDYRLAPEHPAPAAHEDARAAWDRLRALGHPADRIVLAGDSAGAGLALALLADLCASGERPMGLVAFSPLVDLTFSGESFRTNAAADMLLPADRAAELAAYVCGAFDRQDPRISPVHARFVEPPPAMIFVGAQEILRDDAYRIADRLRAAGGEVELAVRDGVPHAWPFLAGWFPEADQAIAEAADFIGRLDALNRPRRS